MQTNSSQMLTLREIFPSVDPFNLQCTLENCDNNLEVAVEATLRSMGSTSVTAETSQHRERQKLAKQPKVWAVLARPVSRFL
jgi:hypothetical protein